MTYIQSLCDVPDLAYSKGPLNAPHRMLSIAPALTAPPTDGGNNPP